MKRMEQNISDLGSKRIGPLLAKLAIPTSVGMIANSLYNVVDTIFIGRGVGTLAIAGIGIVFPIQIIIMAIAQLFGMGAASMISRSLGKGDREKASNIAGNSFVASLILGILAAVFILIFADPILVLFGATQDILPFARDYLAVVAFGFIYFPFLVSSNNLIRAEGDAKNAMIVMLAATGVNIALDPVFIFALGLGIKGAAYATIIAQFCGFAYLVSYYLMGRSNLKIKLKHFRLKFMIMKEMVSLGFASFVRQVSMSLLIIVVNNSLKVYGGDIYIAIYAVINRMVMFITMPLFGIVAGVQPMIGFNFGAGKIKRVKDSLKTSVISTAVIGGVFFILLMVFPSGIIGVFTDDKQLVTNGIFPLRMIIMLFPLIGFQIIGAGYFQSIGKAGPSIILSLSRQVIFLLPLLLLLPVFMGLDGIWLSFPIADLLAIALTAIILALDIKKMNRLVPGYQKA